MISRPKPLRTGAQSVRAGAAQPSPPPLEMVALAPRAVVAVWVKVAVVVRVLMPLPEGLVLWLRTVRQWADEVLTIIGHRPKSPNLRQN